MASSNGTAPPPTTSSAVAPSSSSTTTQPDPSAHKTAPDRILIPYNQVGRRSTTLSDTSSTRSILSSASSSSASSILPIFRSIQRSHFFQFCATVLLLFIVPLAVLVAYKKEFRSDAFAIGVAAFLASETLRQIVFDLVTPHVATRYRVPAAEYENLVLDDDPRDHVSSLSIVHRHHGDDDHEDDHEDDGPLPPSQSSPAIPTLVYSIAQEALRLGAVAVIVRLLPTEVPLAASSFVATSDSLIPLPPPSHPSEPTAPPSHHGGDLPPLDPLFWSALWLALGWGGGEILWGSKRLWNQLQLYRDVLPLYRDQVEEGQEAAEREVLLGVPAAADYGATGESNGAAEHAHFRDGIPVTNADWLEYAARWPHATRRQDDDLEQGTAGRTASFDGDDDEEAAWDFEYRVREAQRDELEEQLGVPLYEVPVGIIFIWRLDRCALFSSSSSLRLKIPSSSLFPGSSAKC